MRIRNLNENDDKSDDETINYNDCNRIMTKIELFQNYLNIFNKLKTHCENGKFYNEPFTCENDELRKLWYYYNKPYNYLMYRNNEELLDFLIESEYPTPMSKIKGNNTTNSGGFYNNKYILLLLLLAF